MIVNRLRVALELLTVLQGFHYALDRLVLDLAIGIDALLDGLAVLPELISFRHLGHAQNVAQRTIE